MARSTFPDLPITAVLPDIQAALRGTNRLVLAAPPGAGKTTLVPLALLEDLPANSRILLLEPRRIAARAAASRMAALMGEQLGQTVGLTTRIERHVSPATRIEVITDGLFTRRILADPELDGIAAVIFDEVHERSLNVDLGLALALDVQSALREDLKLVLMSATLDTARVSNRLGAPSIESEGRIFPVETRYLGRSNALLGDAMADAITRALRDATGSILAFLPGAGDIRRTQAALAARGLGEEVRVHPLFGALAPGEQDRAIAPAPEGTRKIVLATDIAESALTIEGVRIVVDAGLARLPDRAPGRLGTRLVTVRASRASVDQRRGRAGRTAPGVCYRLWDEAETRGLTPEIEPEILRSDLSGLALALADWGTSDPGTLTWLDPPPAGRFAAARDQLTELGALDAGGAITTLGRAMAALPLEPRLAALIARTEAPGEKALAARIAALMSEPGMGGRSADLAERLAGFAADTSPRARALKRQAERWGGRARPAGDAASILARAWPGAIARRRPGQGATYLSAAGEAAQLAPDERLAKSDWLVIAETVGAAGQPRITLAAEMNETAAREIFPPISEDMAAYDPGRGRVIARRRQAIGAITLSEAPLPAPAPEIVRAAMLEAARAHGLALIDPDTVIPETRARIALLKRVFGDPWPDWSEADLLAEAEDWLAPLLGRDGTPPDPAALRAALTARLGWPLQRDIERLAPRTLKLPSGRAAPVDYLDEKAPLVEARVQEVFGPAPHPVLAGGPVPVTLALTSPARRPVAITQDLPGFWAGGYHDMIKDMRARYPKHDWPDDPSTARPHEGRTKARL